LNDLPTMLDQAALLAEDAKDAAGLLPDLSRALCAIVARAAQAGLLDGLVAALTHELHRWQDETLWLGVQDVRAMLDRAVEMVCREEGAETGAE